MPPSTGLLRRWFRPPARTVANPSPPNVFYRCAGSLTRCSAPYVARSSPASASLMSARRMEGQGPSEEAEVGTKFYTGDEIAAFQGNKQKSQGFMV